MESTPLPELLVVLGRQRWLIPVMAEFARREGQRFVELHRRLGVPRDSLSRTLDAVSELGWIGRNPGHGHPLRPEYVLKAEGAEAARLCGRIVAQLTQAGVSPSGLTRWSLPALWAVANGSDRFNQLARCLSPATPRALSMALQNLAANDLVCREVLETYPPTSRYSLTEQGQRLARAC
jgi:DNA-binding HxlR family transcriptional regulator